MDKNSLDILQRAETIVEERCRNNGVPYGEDVRERVYFCLLGILAKDGADAALQYAETGKIIKSERPVYNGCSQIVKTEEICV